MEALMAWAMHSYVLFLWGCRSEFIPVLMPTRPHYFLIEEPFCVTPGVLGVNVGSRRGICGGASNERRCECGGGVSYSDGADGADPDCWGTDKPGQNPGFVTSNGYQGIRLGSLWLPSIRWLERPYTRTL
ncbi:hypothetical protein EV401DRAFT_1986123 [Pisolithus croceorrhizus]|nr:hypothetical protein EV401DRAFT_1986123 [Pisolithus croceorrhizus]